MLADARAAVVLPNPHAAESAAVLLRNPAPFSNVRLVSNGFVPRILILALLFAAELIVISVFLDTASLARGAGLTGIVGDWGSWVLRGTVGFAAIFVTFAYLKSKAALGLTSVQTPQAPIAWGLLTAHGFAIVIFGGLSSRLFGSGISGYRADLFALGWLVAGVSAIAFAGFAFLPWRLWILFVRSTGHLWAYALIAVALACVSGGNIGQWLWKPASRLTFSLSKAFLSPFVSGIVANPATKVLGTQRFSVEITPQCSGLEGAGLILAFGLMWLLLFRKECRFPQSLILIPAGVAIVFLLNSVRIAALILIGHAGAQRIAAGGFHSQAGWIVFNAVAVGFCFAVRRVSWFTATQQDRESLPTAAENPTAAYLLPFLMILAAGMIAGAAASGFEWLYPLRFFAAAGMLWVLRRSYADLDWRFEWSAPVIGAIVFVIWIGLDRFSHSNADQGAPAVLMASSEIARMTWITFRLLAAVVTVPLAEELAFRGYLLRRLVSPDFESVSFRRFTWFALLASSAAFGLLHGEHWLAGILAGILFGLATIRRSRIGEAVVAHATANVLLAAYVLIYNKWYLW